MVVPDVALLCTCQKFTSFNVFHTESPKYVQCAVCTLMDTCYINGSGNSNKA